MFKAFTNVGQGDTKAIVAELKFQQYFTTKYWMMSAQHISVRVWLYPGERGHYANIYFHCKLKYGVIARE